MNSGKTRQQQLKELFARWKIKQGEESSFEGYPDTFPEGKNGKRVSCVESFNNSFCRDGFLGNSEEPVSILFIGRESDVDGKAETDDYFWFQEVIEAKKNYSYTERTRSIKDTDAAARAKQAETKYYNYCCRLEKAALGGNAERIDGCAYMNINKRGGFGGCNLRRLGNYAKEYADFIRQEIELINPAYIICCGTFGTVVNFDLIPEKLKKDSNFTVWDCYHPCCSAKVKGKYKFNQDGKLEKLSPV